MFFVIGWIAYSHRNHRRSILIQSACAAADVAVLLLANHLPESDWYEWALQSWTRRSAFLYLVAYTACSALTFSVAVVLPGGPPRCLVRWRPLPSSCTLRRKPIPSRAWLPPTRTTCCAR
jgi:hypothetical protein